jgi:hypothetical protein
MASKKTLIAGHESKEENRVYDSEMLKIRIVEEKAFFMLKTDLLSLHLKLNKKQTDVFMMMKMNRIDGSLDLINTPFHDIKLNISFNPDKENEMMIGLSFNGEESVYWFY